MNLDRLKMTDCRGGGGGGGGGHIKLMNSGGLDWSRSCGRKRSRGMVGKGYKVAARAVVVVVIVVVVSEFAKSAFVTADKLYLLSSDGSWMPSNSPGVKFPEVVEVIELSPQPYLLVPGVYDRSPAWMMRMQDWNAARCHPYRCGMAAIANARVHRVRARVRGHTCRDSRVGGDVEVEVVVVVGTAAAAADAEAEAVVVEEVKDVRSPLSAAGEQLGRRMEASEGRRLDEGVQRLSGRQRRRFTCRRRRHGVRGTR